MCGYLTDSIFLLVESMVGDVVVVEVLRLILRTRSQINKACSLKVVHAPED